MDTWQELKCLGSTHYKTNGAEPIDLFRAIVPHMDLTVMEVKALSDAIKYAFRMLQNGTNTSDCDKIIHYIRLAKVCLNDRQNGREKPHGEILKGVAEKAASIFGKSSELKTSADLYAGKGHEELIVNQVPDAQQMSQGFDL